MEIVFLLMGLILVVVGLFQGQLRLAYVLLLFLITLMLASALRDDIGQATSGTTGGILPQPEENDGKSMNAER